jgi:hypothetical protein
MTSDSKKNIKAAERRARTAEQRLQSLRSRRSEAQQKDGFSIKYTIILLLIIGTLFYLLKYKK